MSRNGSGVYNLPVGNPVVTGSTISSSWANTTLTDMANALTGSLAADGQTPVTGPINMASNKISNLANGTASGDAVNFSQLTSPVITGGTIDNVPIGSTTASTGKFTVLQAISELIAPTGTTAQRYDNVLGAFRFNTTYGQFEGCTSVTSGVAISSITHVTTTATLTTSSSHGLSTGATITVSGASPSAYNGTYIITVTNTNSFTYVMATDPGANATTVGTYVVGTWGAVGGGATGTGGDQVFVQNSQIITASYTIPTGKNASTVGPITLNSGVSVTIPSGSRWVVL